MSNIFKIAYEHDQQRDGYNLQAPNRAKITGMAGTLAVAIEFGWARVTETIEGTICGAPYYAGGKIRGEAEIRANLRIQLDGTVRISDVRSNEDRYYGRGRWMSPFFHPAMMAEMQAMRAGQAQTEDSAEAIIGKALEGVYDDLMMAVSEARATMAVYKLQGEDEKAAATKAYNAEREAALEAAKAAREAREADDASLVIYSLFGEGRTGLLQSSAEMLRSLNEAERASLSAKIHSMVISCWDAAREKPAAKKTAKKRAG